MPATLKVECPVCARDMDVTIEAAYTEDEHWEIVTRTLTTVKDILGRGSQVFDRKHQRGLKLAIAITDSLIQGVDLRKEPHE